MTRYTLTVKVPITHDYFIRTGKGEKSIKISSTITVGKMLLSLHQGEQSKSISAYNLLHELNKYEYTAENGCIWCFEYHGEPVTLIA